MSSLFRRKSPQALALFLLLCAVLRPAESIGNEKAQYPQPTYEEVVALRRENSIALIQQDTYRQDMCERYDMVRVGNITLRDALQGLELRPLMRVGDFFRYTDEDGINPIDPGLLAVMMDELGRRAGFTWRNSFGVVHTLPDAPLVENFEESSGNSMAPNVTREATAEITFSDLLIWSTETYDISVNWWDQTLERLERGASFLQPWFDGSIVMIQQRQLTEIDDTNIELWNWLRPFEPQVWAVTVFTIIFSGFAYAWLEYLSGHRRNRTFAQWISDNVYLSAISFPQNYEFQPRSAGARIFGVSISIWALVMTATYTANLASLLVDTKAPRFVVESMDDVVASNIPVCVYANTGVDSFLKLNYKQAVRIPFATEVETYEGLNNGECEITMAYYQNWLGFESRKAYNPSCNLEWVGRTVKTIESGFAVNADTGYKCSGLIGAVLDVYLNELLATGFIEDMWENHYAKSTDINCDAVSPELLSEKDGGGSGSRSRRLESQSNEQRGTARRTGQSHRRLKAGARAGGGLIGGLDSVDASQMTLNQMAGTFILHFWVTGLAIIVGYISRYYNKFAHKKVQRVIDKGMDVSSRFLNRQFRPRQSDENYSRRGTLNDSDSNENDDVEHEEKPFGSSKADRRKSCDVIFEDSDDEDKVSQKDWKRLQKELTETKQELRETRREMSEQMNLVVKLLGDIQQGQEKATTKGNGGGKSVIGDSSERTLLRGHWDGDKTSIME